MANQAAAAFTTCTSMQNAAAVDAHRCSAHLLLVLVPGHVLSQPSLQLLSLLLHLLHLIKARLQECLVLVQQVEMGG